MSRDPGGALDFQHSLGWHALPLRYGLGGDGAGEGAGEIGGAADGILGARQRLFHACGGFVHRESIESIAYAILQAKLSNSDPYFESCALIKQVFMSTRGARIKHVRRLNRLTQEQFAEYLSSPDKRISRGAVGNWERDEGIASDNIDLIVERFGVSHNWLATGRGTPPQAVTLLGKKPMDNSGGGRSLTSGKRRVASDFPLGFSDGDEGDTPAVFQGGRVNVPKGEIPQVAARIGMGVSTDEPVITIPIGHGSIAATPVVDTWRIPESVLRRRLSAGLGAVHILEAEGDSMYPTIKDGDFVFVDTGRRVPSPPGIFALYDGFGQTIKRLELVPNSEPPRVVLIPDNPKHKEYERLLDEVSIIGRYIGRLTLE